MASSPRGAAGIVTDGGFRDSPEGRSILGLYPPTEEQSRIDFATWRAANGR